VRGEVEAFLHRHRHAQQRAALVAPRAVQHAGALAGAVVVLHHHGVELRVEPLHPFDEMIEQFEAADIAAADHSGQPRGRQKAQVRHSVIPSWS
jgi:hypothetical protein